MSWSERHHSPKYYAELWGKSTSTVRRMFQNEPGVVLDGQPSRRVGKKLKRFYYTMSIPESIAVKVYERKVVKRPPNGRPLQHARHHSQPPADSSSASREP
jgi:hypothetical protein